MIAKAARAARGEGLRRQRVVRSCQGCGGSFERRGDSKARFCGALCASLNRPAVGAETRLKLSAVSQSRWTDTERKERMALAVSAATRSRLTDDPAERAALIARAELARAALPRSPEAIRARALKCARTLRTLWSDPLWREPKALALRARALAGQGFASPAARARSAQAASWILRGAWREFLTSTDYAETFRRVQERLRAEMPWDGLEDYRDYSAKLGTATVSDPELLDTFKGFMPGAISRWSAAWLARGGPSRADPQPIASA